MKKYRVFTNDRGPHSYSALTQVEGHTDQHALEKAQARVKGLANFNGRPLRVLIVPEPADKITDTELEKLSRERFK